MRIVAGVAGGRRLTVPPAGTRPTSDRVRESLFAALVSVYGTFAGLRVLDLYAGSGALGLESLSRGAARATLVESDRRAAAVARANVAAVGLPGAEVRAEDVGRLLRRGSDAPYDLVLADPPYDLADVAVRDVLVDLAAYGWLADGARAVVERRADVALSWPAGWQAVPVRRYGGTALHQALWYRRGSVDADPED